MLITLARKPTIGPVAHSVQQGGTGTLNIDACRQRGVGPSGLKPFVRSTTPEGYNLGMAKAGRAVTYTDNPLGRWPANVLHDGCPSVLNVYGDAARFFRRVG